MVFSMQELRLKMPSKGHVNHIDALCATSFILVREPSMAASFDCIQHHTLMLLPRAKSEELLRQDPHT
jgi:hypothetical protein